MNWRAEPRSGRWWCLELLATAFSVTFIGSFLTTRYRASMVKLEPQRLIRWTPCREAEDKAPSFGDLKISSHRHQRLAVSLPYHEGKLHLDFKDVRAFKTIWDGDADVFLTTDQSNRPEGSLFKVENSHWLWSGQFTLDIESSETCSDAPWEHFYIVSAERCLQIVARDDVETLWFAGVWSGEPGSWKFAPDLDHLKKT
ncbi:hypothetical protein BSY18_246 [Blastomonas sp. RAC04]|nr:hypothetical protein BSY18_246 [Blastomonas sp. RAC04]